MTFNHFKSFILNYSKYTVILIAMFLAGCGTRSISDSGYQHNPYYVGELSEFDILGIEPIEAPTGDLLPRIAVPKGSRVLLIQSGAPIPDQEFISELSDYYQVSVFSGVPVQQREIPYSNQNPHSFNDVQGSFAVALRDLAKKGNIHTIIAYWGFLESNDKNSATKSISWVPIVGAFIPDEKQDMHIKLKVAVVDVKTGMWDIFVPQGFTNEKSSSTLTRASSDQKQVFGLKEQAYLNAVNELVLKYGISQ